MAYEEELVDWTSRLYIFETRSQTELLKWRTFLWLGMATLSTVGYMFAFGFHGFKPDQSEDIALLSACGVMTIVISVLCYCYLCRQVTYEFRISNTKFVAALKTVCDTLGVYGCTFILNRIKKHTHTVCWIYVAASGFSLGAFRAITPTYELSIPNMLAQVAMNESLVKRDYGGELLSILVAVACFLIFLAQGILDVNWEWYVGLIGVAQVNTVDEEAEGWTYPLIFIYSRPPSNKLQTQRGYWIMISLISIAGYTFGIINHYTDSQADHSSYSFVVTYVLMISISIILLLLRRFALLLEFKFKSKRVHTFAKIVFEAGGVYICYYILQTLSHTHGVCWMFVSLALYALASLKIISPPFDFSLPSLLAQVAINESLNEENEGDTAFRTLVFCACFTIFVIQAMVDYQWTKKDAVDAHAEIQGLHMGDLLGTARGRGDGRGIIAGRGRGDGMGIVAGRGRGDGRDIVAGRGRGDGRGLEAGGGMTEVSDDLHNYVSVTLK